MRNLMDFQVKNVKTLQELSNKKMGDTVVKFTTTTESIYNFCVCEYGITDNIADSLEYTLNMLLDAKKSDMEIYSILGAFIPTEEEMEDMEEFGEYYNIDLGYCINGLITSWETVVIPEKTEQQKSIIAKDLKILFLDDLELLDETFCSMDGEYDFMEGIHAYNMEDFDEVEQGKTPTEIMMDLTSPNFDHNHYYFIFNDLDNLVSYYNLSDFYLDYIDDLIDSILDNLDTIQNIITDDDILNIIL